MTGNSQALKTKRNIGGSGSILEESHLIKSVTGSKITFKNPRHLNYLAFIPPSGYFDRSGFTNKTFLSTTMANGSDEALLLSINDYRSVQFLTKDTLCGSSDREWNQGVAAS